MYIHLYITADSRPASSEEHRFFSLINSRSHSALPGSRINTIANGPPHDFHKKKCSGITIILRFDNKKTQTPFCVPKPHKNGELGTRSWEINCALLFIISCHLYQHLSESICREKNKTASVYSIPQLPSHHHFHTSHCPLLTTPVLRHFSPIASVCCIFVPSPQSLLHFTSTLKKITPRHSVSFTVSPKLLTAVVPHIIYIIIIS